MDGLAFLSGCGVGAWVGLTDVGGGSPLTSLLIDRFDPTPAVYGSAVLGALATFSCIGTQGKV